MRFLVILWRTAPPGNLFFTKIQVCVFQQHLGICFSTKSMYLFFNKIHVIVFQQNPWIFGRMEFWNSGSAPKSLEILANEIWNLGIWGKYKISGCGYGGPILNSRAVCAHTFSYIFAQLPIAIPAHGAGG